MTAEIALANKHGIALAADSAVTISAKGSPKVLGTANKIFALSKYRPVGVMIYGGAELLRMPWETTVKEYRRHLGHTSFDTIHQYATHFIEFLASNYSLFSDDERSLFARGALRGYLSQMRDELFEDLETFFPPDAERSLEEVLALAREMVESHCEAWRASSDVHEAENERQAVIDGYRELIEETKRELFEELVDDDVISDRLSELGTLFFTKVPPFSREGSTGIVIAGFGEKELFPSIWAAEIIGLAHDHVIHTNPYVDSITLDEDAFLVPFAQREMVDTFMAGVDPGYQQTVEAAFERLVTALPDVLSDTLGTPKLTSAERKQLEEIKQDILTEYREGLADLRQNQYIDPIIGMVGSLPKEDLAEMAESLVNLTSFKRKVSPELETVGGPIDVALISKGDGFIWIKRKHYFEPERNPQFFANYYREDSHA